MLALDDCDQDTRLKHLKEKGFPWLAASMFQSNTAEKMWLSPQQQEHMALAAHMVAGRRQREPVLHPLLLGRHLVTTPDGHQGQTKALFHPSPTGKFTSLLDLLTMMSEGFHTEV